MARLARIVIPGLAHHVTLRGNRRERVLFPDVDYRFYLDELCAAAVESRGVGGKGKCGNCHRIAPGLHRIEPPD